MTAGRGRGTHVLSLSLSFPLSSEPSLTLTLHGLDPSLCYGRAGTGVTADYFGMSRTRPTLRRYWTRRMRRYVLRALSNSTLDTAYEINYMSGQGEGRRYPSTSCRYSPSLMSTLCLRRHILPWEPVPSPPPVNCRSANTTTVLWRCTRWRRTTASCRRTRLADYGENVNLLECVPQYQHAVPALNAANVWMLRELAQLDDLLFEAPRGCRGHCRRACREAAFCAAPAATAIWHALRPMYVAGALLAAAAKQQRRPAVRTVIDFHTIGSLLGAPPAPCLRTRPGWRARCPTHSGAR